MPATPSHPVVPRSVTDHRTAAAHLQLGTTVRYRWRDGSGLATVVERTDGFVRFDGPDCDGRFTLEQVERLIADDRLSVVLDDGVHAPFPWWVDGGDP